VCCIALFSLFNFAYADTSVMEDRENTLIMGADSWPPFRFINGSEVSGIDNELLKKLAKRMGFKVQYQLCPWKRCLKMMENGQIDGMSGLAWRKERAEYITYTAPSYYQCSTQFYLPKGQARLISKHRDLHSMNIGIVSGSAYYEAFDRDSDINKQSVTQEAVLPDLLLNKRIDAFIGTDCQADYELQLRGLSEAVTKATFKPGNSVDLYLGLSSKSRWVERKAEFNKALWEIREEQFHENALDLISSSPNPQ
tara:strand:- start:17757 stop:18515 length:759 start_codon:yes stop_codon:yes gene_type:complete